MIMDTGYDNTASAPAIELRDLQFAWRKGAAPVLDIPALRLARGERLFLYGPSGSGKTSLLNLMAGISLPGRGEVTLLGQPLSALSARQRDRFRARHIGVIFQQFNLIPFLSVLDNVCLAAHFAGVRRGTKERARSLLRALNLPEALAGRPAHRLSVGQQQRAAVARALISEPEILLADEPSSALDSDHRDAFMQLLMTQVAALGSTLVFVSHDRGLSDGFDRQQDLTSLSRAKVGEVDGCF